MSDVAALSIELYDADLTRLGWLNDADSLTITWRHNRRGAGKVVVPASHHRAAQLVAPGRRLLVTYVADEVSSPMVWSGRISGVQAQGPVGSSSLVATVVGDWVDGVLAWPVPDAALSAQTVEYYTATGPAETVIKDLIRANAVTRLGRPWTVATDLERGAEVSVSARMVPLSEVVEPAADVGGVGLRMTQTSTGIVIDCYEGADRSAHILSESTGALVAWSLTTSEPGATRAVVGMDGEGVDRVFAAVATDAEGDWGMVVETFVDARDVDHVEDPTGGVRRGTEKLTELAETVSVSTTLAETKVWRVGRNLNLGDLVRVEPLPGISSVERVSEITLTWTAAEGLVVVPVIGDPDTAEPERLLALHLSRIARGIRQLRAR